MMACLMTAAEVAQENGIAVVPTYVVAQEWYQVMFELSRQHPEDLGIRRELVIATQLRDAIWHDEHLAKENNGCDGNTDDH